MAKVEYRISDEPVGYIVYAVEDEKKLSITMLANRLKMENSCIDEKSLQKKVGLRQSQKMLLLFFCLKIVQMRLFNVKR